MRRSRLGHAEHQRVEVERARLQRLPAGEGQQPPGQRRRRARPPASASAERRGARRSCAESRRQQLEVADDDGQQVVEIVRDAAGELADRLHLLRLAQLRLGFALGDVAQDDDEKPRGFPRPGRTSAAARGADLETANYGPCADAAPRALRTTSPRSSRPHSPLPSPPAPPSGTRAA